ncbi:TetR/AcrR family transcriptional regulator [Microbacterium sp. LTA6]|uniref:TetR/AcrR family transcriptional regulator n=1 Tax=Microbacterium sp. LTA6 TaxID=3129771 RepID=UPI00325207DE
MTEDIPGLIALLWRHERTASPRRGPKPRFTVDSLVSAAIELADAEGADAVSMRGLATALGSSAMSLYSYVPDKSTLIALMADQVTAAMRHGDYSDPDWRVRLDRLAHDNLDLHLAHPWLGTIRAETPPLGPGIIGKYERELAAIMPLGLSAVDTDASLSLIIGFARSSAADLAAAVAPDPEWWQVAGPALAEHVTPQRFPLADAIGSAAGAEHNAAYDARHAWRFGLDRILDGIASMTGAGMA